MLNDIDQMTEEPEVIESNDMTVLGPIIFATASVQVLREEEAFTFGSLVADCGGVLGLFIGFNFMMVWDVARWSVKNFQPAILALFDVGTEDATK